MSRPDLQIMLKLAADTYAKALETGLTEVSEVGDLVNAALEDYIKSGDFPKTTSYKFVIQGDEEGKVIKNGVVKANFLGGGLNIEIVEEHITLRNLQAEPPQEAGKDSVLKDLVIGQTLRHLTGNKSMSIDDQMRDAVSGIGRKEDRPPEEIVAATNAHIPAAFGQELVLKSTFNAATGETASEVINKAHLTDGERQLLEQAQEGNTALDAFDKQWLAMVQKPFSEDLKEKTEYIKKAVMRELKFTEETQFEPLGMRHHLARLAGHRFNYLDQFEDDIEGMDKDDMRDRLKWFNMLATLDYIVAYSLSDKVGYVEKIELTPAQRTALTAGPSVSDIVGEQPTPEILQQWCNEKGIEYNPDQSVTKTLKQITGYDPEAVLHVPSGSTDQLIQRNVQMNLLLQIAEKYIDTIKPPMKVELGGADWPIAEATHRMIDATDPGYMG